ncbi:MAG: helix-turn-helix domain-containing protein [Paludibacteraceae bacterium]
MPGSKFKLTRNCEICGKQFNAKTIYSKYCSDKCSDKAYRNKKTHSKEEVKKKELAEKIPENRPYISVGEAVLLYGISRGTIYRQIKKGNIPAVNLGERLTRISRAHIEAMFPSVPVIEPQPTNFKTSYKKEESYTIGEVSKKYGISDSTVNKAIRKNGIPRKQIGKFVYVPKSLIDDLFGGKKS